MGQLKLLTKRDLNSILSKRSKETKLGQSIKMLSSSNSIYDSIVKTDVNYVILGIKEDIGVVANNGFPGTCRTWESTINFLLNCQDNQYNSGNKLLILGHLEFPDLEKQLENAPKTKKKRLKIARELTAEIDREVTQIIYDIVRAGKIPIVIGGGHNNAYGLIKGTSLALMKSINAINFDAHADFRAEEGRHSGNGFSYAFGEGFLKNYFAFGLHENYNSSRVLKAMDNLKQVDYNTYDAMLVRQDTDFYEELHRAHSHVASKPFGLEIDCDALEGVPSSAMTPSGFNVAMARQFVYFFGKQQNVRYLHICEAAPDTDDTQRVGKLISYLMTDFIKAHETGHSSV